MRFKPPNGKRLQGAADARRRARKRTTVEEEKRVEASRSGLQFPVGFIVVWPADEIGFLRRGRWSFGVP